MTKESLIKIRKSLGVSQVVFAEMLGYSSAVRINEFEKGTRPITKQLEMTCHYLRLLTIKGLDYETSKATMQIQDIKELYDEHDHILETDISFVERIQNIIFD